jgi:hypothetical protein
LEPLITLLAEQIVRDVLKDDASTHTEARKLHAPTRRPENSMANTRTQKKRSINPWTAADLQTLRKQAGHASVEKIAKALKRSEGADSQKAGSLGISLRLRCRALSLSIKECRIPIGTHGGSQGPPAQANASTPLRSITFSSFSEGPLGRFSPISHFCTVDTLVLSTAANTA